MVARFRQTVWRDARTRRLGWCVLWLSVDSVEEGGSLDAAAYALVLRRHDADCD
jgi:hypothetical protein